MKTMEVLIYGGFTDMVDICPLCGCPRKPVDGETRLIDYAEFFCGSFAFMRGDRLLVLHAAPGCASTAEALELIPEANLKTWKFQIFPPREQVVDEDQSLVDQSPDPSDVQ